MPPSNTRITTRKRSLPLRLGQSTLHVENDYTSGAVRHTESFNKVLNFAYTTLDGKQVTVSENHPYWRRREKRFFPGDVGGEFFSQRTYTEPFEDQMSVSGILMDPDRSTHKAFYKGVILPLGFLVNPGPSKFPPFINSSNSELDAYGTTAIARCKPTNPPADLATALIELKREGLPHLVGSSLWKSKTKAAKAAGNEFLNVQFGYLPMVNDIVNTALVIDRADALIEQYKRDAGKIVRRSYSFPPIESEDSVLLASDVSPAVLGPTHGAMYKAELQNKGKVYRVRNSSKSCWFSGAFTYHLPIDPITMKEVSGRRGLISRMLGLDLTPSTLWNLTPWSWAADWFYNTGDIVSNLQSYSIDGLVLKYGYVMEHSVVRDTYFFTGPTGFQSGTVPPPVTLVSETKIRRKATPFGFGKTWGSLTPRQLAIAAALGLTNS